MHNTTFKQAFVKSLPVMAGYIVIGMAFGILLQSKGYNLLWAVLLSVTIYAGSMQFVAINLLTGGATLVAAAMMTLVVNARHVFYGLSMLTRYRNMGAAKPYLIFALTDETYALVCVDPPNGVDRKRFYVYISALNQAYWVIGSAIGSLLGMALPFELIGIDFAMTALFVVIFVEQFLTTRDHVPAYIGVCASAVCLMVFGPGGFLIPAMVLIVLALSALRWVRERGVRADG